MDASAEGNPVLPDETTAPPPRRVGWWLRAAEVRLRFVGLVLAALFVVAGWDWIRAVWDRLWYAASADAANAAVSADTEYFCPMDPGVTSAWPAVCPICNMDLVQRKKHDAQILPEGVIARMQFSPYRVQLAGIRTSPVEPRPLQYEIRVTGALTEMEHGDGNEASDVPAAILGFEAPLSPADAPLIRQPRAATVTTLSEPTWSAPAAAELLDWHAAGSDEVAPARTPRVRIRLTSPMESPPQGTLVAALIQVPAAEMTVPQTGAGPSATPGAVLAVPESAVVDRGQERVVFVESMPGTFDAVIVDLGRRCGDYYPVLSGLKPGQAVATAGAFLIDAETRLNSSAAVAYFGANQAGGSRVPEVHVARGGGRSAPKLTAEQQELARRQAICPVTGLELDSMGGPVPVEVEGRTVFICCAGCEGKLKADPARYFAKLPAP